MHWGWCCEEKLLIEKQYIPDLCFWWRDHLSANKWQKRRKMLFLFLCQPLQVAFLLIIKFTFMNIKTQKLGRLLESQFLVGFWVPPPPSIFKSPHFSFLYVSARMTMTLETIYFSSMWTDLNWPSPSKAAGGLKRTELSKYTQRFLSTAEMRPYTLIYSKICIPFLWADIRKG